RALAWLASWARAGKSAVARSIRGLLRGYSGYPSQGNPLYGQLPGRSALHLSGHERAGCVCAISWALRVAKHAGSALSASRLYTRPRIRRGGRVTVGGYHSPDALGSAALPLSAGWLVLVSGDPGSGDRPDSGGLPGLGGSLHLCSAHRHPDYAHLVC